MLSRAAASSSVLLQQRRGFAVVVRRGGAALSAARSSSFSFQCTGWTLASLAPPAAWSAARRWQSSNGVGYGTVPSDIDAPRDAHKPLEEDVHRAERRRQHGHAGTAEEADREAVSTHVAGYNPWEVLGLKPGASTQTIRVRYHELMKEVHPDMATDGVGDIPRLNQINKAYELITKSPTLDRRYRNLVSDTQYFYYKFLPEWMARNVDEMPRYWSWVKWRTPGGFHVFLLLVAFYVLGRFYAAFPMLTTVFLLTVVLDILLHTMLAPASLCMLFLYSILAYRSYDMAWLTSPKGFLRRELGY
ncbi:putative mitochondrial chaperone protein DNAj [Leptomonas pyrrhocoris]|uniref:Putative mitochondrial chaperone protein DNAj n=1 Tax=Leptomonas pyrrhocoris TaxID=157538 RepID=A0A0M9FU51_LEPPY|nr:putative mitochondrial chaperone protein DNAj [Leptomonas pyrrhocoris]KPA76135.1 putative mitochondrial chaperone protein DNAj [Leptomonas pyrrhocoris]|eukprot:XP_015654574.1 putative mitochondrial chaperone protein DNAj [Leptomonas pyrrhocoris]